MIFIKNQKAQTSIALLAILTFSMVFSFLTFESNLSYTPAVNVEEPSLLTSGVGEDPWWNGSYQWRQCINITNPGAYNLTDNFIKITFNWQDIVTQGKMQADLDDVRIVENGVLRRYHIRKDFPTTNIATVWFETNSTEGTSDFDTYMYYGNSGVERATIYYEDNCPDGNAWWGFEEGMGTTALDSMGNYDADLLGTGATTPTYVPGRIESYALEFNGNNEYSAIQGLSFTEPNEIEELTVSVWFRTSFSGGSYSSNWAFFDYDRSETFDFYLRGDDGRIGFSTSASGTSLNDFYGSSAGLNDGQWHFACIVYDGTDKIIYIDNGVEDARWANAHSGVNLGTGTDRFGFIGDGSEANAYDGNRNNIYYDGNVDELRYFNYSVSPNEISWLANYYPLSTELLDVVERAATVTVFVNDVDGKRVPNAKVSLWNGTDILNISGLGEFTQLTNGNGYTEFTGIPFGSYNLTVNYTLQSGLYEEIVYDSRTVPGGEVDFVGLFTNVTVYADLWTIDFEVVDLDGEPLDYGYVEVNDTTEVLETLTLDSNGMTTFRWLTRSSYDYMVYYDNDDYTIQNPTLVNYSTISRVTTKTTYNVNETNDDLPANPTYSVNEDTFVPGSSLGNPGNLTVIDATVNFINMQDEMDEVNIWFMDDTGYRSKESTIYTGVVTDDTYTYHPRYDESFDVYGLRFEVEGQNASRCNGIIEVSLTYDYIQSTQVQMSKLNVRVIDNTETVPVEGVTVRVEESGTTNLVTELKTDDMGYAYGLINTDLEFWYKTGWIYNFSLWIVNTRYNFYVNYSDQAFNPSTNYDNYSYTLNSASLLIFELDLDFQNRITTFENGSLLADTSVVWGEDMTFSLNFTTSTNGGSSWIGDDGVGTVITCAVKSTAIGNPTLHEVPMNFIGSGIYSIDINSGLFSAGTSGKSYLISISGAKEAFFNPTDENFVVSINSLPTGMSLHEYSTLAPIPSNQVSQYYNDLINLTLKFYDFSTTNPIVADSMTYDWDYGSGSINPDPMNPGYYTIEIDTSDSPNTGQYKIEINAQRENYTKVERFDVFLEILSRATTINDTTTLFQHSPTVYVLDSQNFSYVYKDSLLDTVVGDLDVATYNWYKLDENGDPLTGPGNEGSGTLVEAADHRYILDFDTETREVGEYTIFITLQKMNYEVRNGFVALSISTRPITVDLAGTTGLSGSQINIVQGSPIHYKITLVDPTNGSQPLRQASVVLNLQGTDYILIETQPGVYEYILSTTDITAFFIPNTLQGGQITISKADYDTKMIQITVIVGMTELFGFPLFYLILIAGGIIAVVGTALIYRGVQKSRIPKFVKKARSMKKAIKGKKSVSDSDTYPTKREFIVKKLGDKWEMLGLSLEEILGVEGKKKKKLPEAREPDGGVM